MSKNIVICCDGTANEFAEDNTNVVKLYYVLNQDQIKQATFYHPGLGTMEPAGALTTFSRQVTKLLGKWDSSKSQACGRRNGFRA